MLIGYLITLATVTASLLLLGFAYLEKRRHSFRIPASINRYSVLILGFIFIFFILFALLYVHPVEQLYFDENIYQGIALNILHSGNALWCQYGTGQLSQCYIAELYHDIVGYDVFIAAAFAIFGSSAAVAFGLQLLMGALSIVGVYLLAAVLTERKEVPIIASLVMATIPELFIWSRTQAVPDLPFMTLTVFTAFFFVLFARKPNTLRLGMFCFSLILTLYTRTEGELLLPIFVVFYFILGSEGIKKTFAQRMHTLKRALDSPEVLLVVLVFTMLLLPLVYYSVTELQSPSYGNSAGQSLFSFGNFLQNIGPNSQFLLGMTQAYPIISTVNLLPLAVIGALSILLYEKTKNRFAVMLITLALFLSYFLFYPFFYAGSVGYGVDVRFILQILPFLAVLAGFGVMGIGQLIDSGVERAAKHRKATVRYAIYGILTVALVVVPFAYYAPYVTIPTNQMPQESYPLNATAFFYNNYTAVPTSCLVFTFTPDLWFQYNRSAAQIGYLGGANQSITDSFKNYSCYVLDYDYWCTVPPYQNTLCSSLLSRYATTPLASESNGRGSQFAFYRLLNYSP